MYPRWSTLRSGTSSLNKPEPLQLLDMPRVAVLYLFSVRHRTPRVSRRRVDLESPVFKTRVNGISCNCMVIRARLPAGLRWEVHQGFARCPQPGHTWFLRHIGVRSLIIWIVLVSSFFTFEILDFNIIDLLKVLFLRVLSWLRMNAGSVP